MNFTKLFKYLCVLFISIATTSCAVTGITDARHSNYRYIIEDVDPRIDNVKQAKIIYSGQAYITKVDGKEIFVPPHDTFKLNEIELMLNPGHRVLSMAYHENQAFSVLTSSPLDMKFKIEPGKTYLVVSKKDKGLVKYRLKEYVYWLEEVSESSNEDLDSIIDIEQIGKH